MYLVKILTKLSLPVACALSREKLLEKITYDKKSVNRQIRWVMLKGIGTAVPGQTISNTVIYMALKEVVI